MRKLCFAISVVGLLFSASPPARAQEPDTLSAAQRAGLALARLGGDTQVRIHASGVGRVSGWVVSSSPNLVTLQTDGSRIQVPAPGIDSLWVRSGGHAGKGALIGAAVAGIGLGAVAAILVHNTCDTSGGCDDAGGFVGGLAVGGAAGALIGALIGAAFPKWQLRLP
jgi:hypothetical protein